MTAEEQELLAQRSVRIARTKRLLRWLPRKANLHRYPVVKWFAAAARQRGYLWSFRVRPVVASLYAGSILSFMPLYGIQALAAVLLSFALRANLAVMVGLQLITNPFTVVPAYYAGYQVGRVMLSLVGVEVNNLNRAQLEILLNNMFSGKWGSNVSYFFGVWGVTMLGGFMIGLFVATICSWIYRFAAMEFARNYERLREIQRHRMAGRETTSGSAQRKMSEGPNQAAGEAYDTRTASGGDGAGTQSSSTESSKAG
ncbi:MAG: DUF2062 domain-containing protein [Opitutales bacterium]|nr:DUF2062 domain-containing protein [Opitutales bacterium]